MSQAPGQYVNAMTAVKLAKEGVVVGKGFKKDTCTIVVRKLEAESKVARLLACAKKDAEACQ